MTQTFLWRASEEAELVLLLTFDKSLSPNISSTASRLQHCRKAISYAGKGIAKNIRALKNF